MEDLELTAADYQKIEKLIPTHVQEIRSVLKNKHGLDIPVHCDEFIARCLRLKDGNVEKAITLIKAFYAATKDFENWNATLQPSRHTDFYNAGAVIPLVKRDAEGRRIVILRSTGWNPEVHNFDQMIVCLWMMTQVVTAKELEFQRKGYVSIWDFRGFGLNHALAVNHMRCLTVARWLHNSIAGRIKGFHAINHPRIVSVIYAAIKPFLKEKMKKRIFFHGNEDSLLKHFPANCLPTYLGGTEDPDECIDKAVLDLMADQDDYFQDMMKHSIPTK